MPPEPGATFTVAPGETITAMALGPLIEEPFPGEARRHPDNVDYVFVNGNTAVGDLPCRDAVRDFVAARGVPDLAPFDVTAVTELRLCVFQRNKFEQLVREMPNLEHRLLEMALDELNSAREWMVLLGRKSAQEKLAIYREEKR